MNNGIPYATLLAFGIAALVILGVLRLPFVSTDGDLFNNGTAIGDAAMQSPRSGEHKGVR